MPRFIALIDFTAKGIGAIQDTVKRSDAFRETAAQMGAEIREVYWTLGAHDGVLVFDAPDDPTATALVIKLGRAGNVQTKTLRAFERAEMQKIVEMSG
ncbi:MAG: GYD domain-containing protein [Acidobacteriota bacterium]|nr:GYD domain-containing protein [Acidobacteriota bacterium]MDH3524114.1 GYD domain-containing protein [Acidobacteriota bacterium]